MPDREHAYTRHRLIVELPLPTATIRFQTVDQRAEAVARLAQLAAQLYLVSRPERLALAKSA